MVNSEELEVKGTIGFLEQHDRHDQLCNLVWVHINEDLYPQMDTVESKHSLPMHPRWTTKKLSISEQDTIRRPKFHILLFFFLHICFFISNLGVFVLYFFFDIILTFFPNVKSCFAFLLFIFILYLHDLYLVHAFENLHDPDVPCTCNFVAGPGNLSSTPTFRNPYPYPVHANQFTPMSVHLHIFVHTTS